MSSSDNDPKKAEEMSLAELLGKSEATSVPPEANNQEEESDDDKSGLINLSQMANMLTQPTPSQEVSSFPGAPGAAPGTTAPTGQVPAGQPAGGIPQGGGSFPPAATGGFPQTSDPVAAGAHDTIASTPKKNPTAIIVIAAIALIAGGVGAFVALSGGDKTEDAPQLSQAETPLDSAKDSVATTEPAAAPAAPAAADNTEAPAADEAEPANADEEENAALAEGEEAAVEDGEGGEDEEYEIMEEEVVDKKGRKKRRKVKRAKRKTTTKSTTTKKETAAPAKKETATASAAPASGGGKKTSALDSLLAGGGGGSAKDSGGLPQKPSRAQVQKAMAPVVRKARNSCKNSGSGKVSVRIIVGSNGVVRDAVPLGAHAADSLGRCVATFARKTARLPAFKAPTFTFTYPFNI